MLTGRFFPTIARADNLPGWAGVEQGVATFASLESVVANILNIATILAGIAFFIMAIVGGLGLLTSGGNPEKVNKAVATLLWAILGLIIMISVWFIFLNPRIYRRHHYQV